MTRRGAGIPQSGGLRGITGRGSGALGKQAKETDGPIRKNPHQVSAIRTMDVWFPDTIRA